MVETRVMRRFLPGTRLILQMPTSETEMTEVIYEVTRAGELEVETDYEDGYEQWEAGGRWWWKEPDRITGFNVNVSAYASKVTYRTIERTI